MYIGIETRGKDARNEVRKVLRCQARILFKNAPSLSGRTFDISPSGICIIAPEHIAPGQSCGLSFSTPIAGKIIEVNTLAKVAYSICIGTTGFRVGFQFVDPDPAARAAINQILK